MTIEISVLINKKTQRARSRDQEGGTLHCKPQNSKDKPVADETDVNL